MIHNFSWKNKRVLVTGSTGLVGSWLVESLLDKGARITVLIKDLSRPSQLFISGSVKKVKVYEGDIKYFTIVKRVIKEQDFEIIYHLASKNINYKIDCSLIQTFDTNIRGTYNLLEACRLYGNESMRIIIASSQEVHDGKQSSNKDNNQIKVRHHYEVSKKSVEMISKLYSNYGLNIRIVRCSNIYGGGDFHWHRIVSGTIRSVVKGNKPIIRTDGSLKRDYYFVEDVISAMMLVTEKMTKSASEIIFDFENNNMIKTLDIVNKIISISKHPKLKADIKNTSKDEVQSRNLVHSQTVDKLGWKSKYSLESGLIKTYDWYEKYFNHKTI